MTQRQQFYLFFISVGIVCLFILTQNMPVRVAAQSTTPQTSASSCTFTRGDQNPKAVPYKSTLLLSYFQQASQKTGVPAAVLAAIARVESTTGTYSLSDYSDDDIRAMEAAAKSGNFDGTIPGTQKALCPKSPTGARGIMQIQPPGTTGNASTAIDNGARFLGKSASDLTLADYCDPKTEMIIAAGFILKKLQGVGYGNGTTWNASWTSDKDAIDAVASSYYGCLIYGDPNRPNDCVGPNNYGDDIWASIQECKDTFANPITVSSSGTTTSNTSGSSGSTGGSLSSNEVLTKVGNPSGPPPGGGGNGTHPVAPPPPDDVRQAIIDKFGIVMNGFNHDNLVWAWDKFWDVSNTRFIDLAKGTVVTQTGGIPEQTGCRSLSINNSASQQRLNVILLHELGHVIDHCNPDSIGHDTDQHNAYAQEGGITGYGSSACFGTPPVNEDYAEMITYYLNPGVTEMIECNNRHQIPFADGKYPIHYQVAKSILGDY